MGNDGTAVSDVATDNADMTLADLDAFMGVINDPTGDYEAGRTVFDATTEEFIAALVSQMRE